MKKTNMKHNKSAPASRQRFIFYIIALFIPLLFFVVLEVGLRLVGFGQQVPLFIENPAHPSYQLPRPDVMSRYFPINAPTPSVTMEANFILKQKPKNGYRVIVQGGSTAAGFPYGLGASIAGTLDQRLKPSMPGRYVEVLNTAMSAINSYTLLDFADEIIAQQPDVVLIYAGHNEFLGILGVGSNYTAMGSGITTRWFLSLKDYRVFQLLQRVYFGLSSSDGSSSVAVNTDPKDILKDISTELQSGQQSRTFMAKVAKNKAIAKDSSIYYAGLEQFESNMSALLAKYSKAGIQVYISTIASNHADQAPFSSLPIESRFSNTTTALFDNTAGLNQQQRIQDLQSASSTLSSSTSADLHFKIAKLALQLQQVQIAKNHFALAVEHDQLRFRAPLAINEIIRKLAMQNSAVLVDSENQLAIRSPKGIVGSSMMLEHLHPNLQGYFVISNAFYQSMVENANIKPFANVSIERAWAERLMLAQEEYYGFATILNLLSDYPFTTQATTPSLPKPADWQQQAGQDFFLKKTSWLQMMQLSLNRYQSEDDQRMVAKTIQILADALPHNGLYNLQIAEIKFKQKRLNESLYYYQRAKLAGAIGIAIDGNIALIERALPNIH
ncbi:SGNH/GDSL hydrolase family protein [Brumicola pallidula]|nr:SGNH/GDSL hydrolase family protein [Glaciecola pallidula]